MAHWDDTLREEIIASQYTQLSSKEELVQHYQQEYPGKEGRSIAWKKHLVSDLLEQKGITPENTDKKEYSRQKKNLDKRFEKRLNSPEPKNKAEYEALGKKVGPIPPKEINYTVHVSGSIRISQWCKPVDFNITIGVASDFSLQGQNAQGFTEEPNMQALVEAYFYDDPGYEGWCEGPEIEIIG